MKLATSSSGLSSDNHGPADERDRLREELARRLTVEHELIDIVRPHLLARYQEKIGAWELRRLEAQTAARRARRKVELARAALNRGAVPDWAEIENVLEGEFLRWQQVVREAAARLAAAGRYLANLLGPEEDRELKRLYHALVKALHPDLHPERGDASSDLWHRGQEAYARRDLGALRALILLAADRDEPMPDEAGSLRRDCEVLALQIAAVERRIREIEQAPPFTWRSQLDDDAWIAERRAALDSEIGEFEQLAAGFERTLAEIEKLLTNGQSPHNN